MSKKILIIDDDHRNTFALSAVLKTRGYECINAASAKEGIEQLEKKQGIRVVLMDMMMPDMDGYEAIAIIRQTQEISNTPVIAVTAQAMLGDREKCLEAGANDYISKPIDVDALLRKLQQY